MVQTNKFNTINAHFQRTSHRYILAQRENQELHQQIKHLRDHQKVLLDSFQNDLHPDELEDEIIEEIEEEDFSKTLAQSFHKFRQTPFLMQSVLPSGMGEGTATYWKNH